ncbi:hypothetical protein GCM10010215_32100 [Streptomyces virginiae]|uniref:Uncharacterized protein n=1 Tax=Streptomyces virginiae TaxID=1961 RepID=A0ABQ3NIE6_STRVG|nr:hypothetical protein GCM10010215_32100 [Streptomyces virginiae]GHI12546.1 hypothetical protein Scinn_20090 [Streptomyces virginiae]GLV88831.1 hypothetical protein Slala04_02850 [Streptomyces lavendulae subsp. lavendulae]
MSARAVMTTPLAIEYLVAMDQPRVVLRRNDSNVPPCSVGPGRWRGREDPQASCGATPAFPGVARTVVPGVTPLPEDITIGQTLWRFPERLLSCRAGAYGTDGSDGGVP